MIQAIIIVSSIVIILALIALTVRVKRWFIYDGHAKRELPITPKRFLFSLYSLIFFIFMVYGIALPITIILYTVVWNRDKRLLLLHKLLRWSTEFILMLLPGIDFTYNNAIGETFNEPGIIISNHQGHFDLLCIMMMTPRLVVLTNEWVWHNPLYGWLIRLAKFYPVGNGLDYNIPRLKELISNGYSIVVFPEGTRSAQCNILRFHSGAFYLAHSLGVDIIPVILHGVGHCIPKNDFMLRPGHMYIEVMNRIKIEPDDKDLYIRRLSKETRAKYIEHYSNLKTRLENSAYFAKYVINKYYYQPHHASHKVSKLLRNNQFYTNIIDSSYKPGSTIIINDISLGACSWLMCLVHEDINIISIIENNDEYLIASNTPAIPSNLVFKNTRLSNDTGEYVIFMHKDGSITDISSKL